MNSQLPRNRASGKGATVSRLPVLLLLALLLLAAAAAAWLLLRPAPVRQGNLAGSSVGGPFTLVDEAGRTVSNASYAGKWRLMYFGFTYCPDICPTDTARLAAGIRAFEAAHPEAAQRLQPLFVTVDPERDSPAALAEFTDSFHPRLVGLTGSRAQVDAALKSFRVYAAKVAGTTPESYTYDHLAIVYLMDPEGRPVQFLAGPATMPEAVRAMLERYLA